MTDSALVKRIQAGDEAALATLVEREYQKVLIRIRRCVPEADAEDVTQDIFMSLMTSIESFAGRSTFQTWFIRFCNNRIVDYYRKVGFRCNAESKSIFCNRTNTVQPDSSLEFNDILSKLPERYAEVLRLRYEGNLSLVDIAEQLGKNYSAARSQFRRAVKCAAGLVEGGRNERKGIID